MCAKKSINKEISSLRSQNFKMRLFAVIFKHCGFCINSFLFRRRFSVISVMNFMNAKCREIFTAYFLAFIFIELLFFSVTRKFSCDKWG